MLRLLRQHHRFFLGTALAGLALRMLFVLHFPAIADDSRIYADFARNWLQTGIYGQTRGALVVPVDTRLPGYPTFLALVFRLFGPGNFRAVMLAQIAFDLAACVLVADIARRAVSDRAARVGFALAALCPFLANYCAAVLTETLEVFFTALALDCALAALLRLEAGRTGAYPRWMASGAAIGACILLRPDGGILLAAVILYLLFLTFRHHAMPRRAPAYFAAAALVAGCGLAPLVPWTARNFRTLHHFQPLAPRYANDADELAPLGFNRWVKTWMVDYVSVEEIYWNVPGDKIDPARLPTRAFDPAKLPAIDPADALIAGYNESQDLTPELDARFGQLAAARIRAHPVRYYVGLPVLRVADMWLRPRTENLPVDPRWWEFNDDLSHSAVAVGFGVLNLGYVGAALGALLFRRRQIRWLGLLLAFVLLRSVFLGTIENPEPRYTLECYPAIIVLAAALAAAPRAQNNPAKA